MLFVIFQQDFDLQFFVRMLTVVGFNTWLLFLSDIKMQLIIHHFYIFCLVYRLFRRMVKKIQFGTVYYLEILMECAR